MPAALIIGYGVAFDAEGRVLLLHRRSGEALWPDQWWLPGGETPIEEDPDSTVPRVFADLLRQEVRAAYIDTTFGPEPSSGRHTVHNGYRVEVVSSLDPQPADERNPFDRMEWFAPEEALSALPQAQAQLLRTAVEHRILGIEPTPADDLDRLLEVGDAPNAAGAAPELPQTTQARRRADGAALLAELTGQAEFAERMEAARGAFGSYLIDHVWGDVWQDGRLSRRERSLAALAAAGALRQHDAFRFNAVIADANGLSREVQVEVCLQLAAAVGFPPANEALQLLQDRWRDQDAAPYPLSPAAGKDDAQRRADAAAAARAMGLPSADLRDVIDEQGVLGRHRLEWELGEIAARDGLTARERLIALIAMQICVGGGDGLAPLLDAAARQGIGRGRLDAVVGIVAVFCGRMRAETAARLVQRLPDEPPPSAPVRTRPHLAGLNRMAIIRRQTGRIR